MHKCEQGNIFTMLLNLCEKLLWALTAFVCSHFGIKWLDHVCMQYVYMCIFVFCIYTLLVLPSYNFTHAHCAAHPDVYKLRQIDQPQRNVFIHVVIFESEYQLAVSHMVANVNISSTNIEIQYLHTFNICLYLKWVFVFAYR